jgi:hypothetical protein
MRTPSLAAKRTDPLMAAKSEGNEEGEPGKLS